MNGISFLSENLTDNAIYTITTGAANAQFPIDNLKLDFTTKKFRSTGNTVVFVVDWQQFRNVDFIAVTGDATTNLGVTAVSVKLSVTLDFSMSTQHDLDLSAKYNIGFVAIDSTNARYAEVTLTGTGSYSELGKIFIGEKIHLQFNNLATSSFKLDRDDNSSVRKNEFGQKFVDIKNSVRTIAGNIQTMTKAEFDIIDDLFILHGRNKPLWVVVDEFGTSMIDGEFKLTGFVQFQNDPSFSASGGQHYNVSMTMELVV